MSSNFNYRIDAPFSEKKRFFRVCVYLVLLPLFTGLSTGMIYVLGNLMNFDINEPIRSSELSVTEIVSRTFSNGRVSVLPIKNKKIMYY